LGIFPIEAVWFVGFETIRIFPMVYFCIHFHRKIYFYENMFRLEVFLEGLSLRVDRFVLLHSKLCLN
jgi:hypothetical protein